MIKMAFTVFVLLVFTLAAFIMAMVTEDTADFQRSLPECDRLGGVLIYVTTSSYGRTSLCLKKSAIIEGLLEE